MIRLIKKSIPKRAIKILKPLVAIPHKLMGNYDYQRFIILSRSRTGSTLLLDLLKSHPNISMKGEIFQKLNGQTTDRIWHDAFSRKLPFIKAVGFKLFYYHPMDVSDKTVWKFMRSNRDIKIIHLTRKNILNTVISREIAKKTKTWEISKPLAQSKRAPKVKLDPKTCLQQIKQTETWESDSRDKLKNHQILEITYRQLANNRTQTLRKVFDFLDVPIKRTSTSLVKQNVQPLKQKIQNYDEIKSVMVKNGYSSFIEE